MIRGPSANPDAACAPCHPVHSANVPGSIHSALWGEKYKLAQRAFGADDLDGFTQINTVFNNECDSCHTTCGQCHVSRPNSVQGGFIYKHKFKRTPSMIEN